jgi:hypothetical protein
MEEKFLEKFLKKYNLPEGTTSNSDLISELYDYDPSPNKKYLHWLYERFVEEFGLRNVKNFNHEYWGNVGDALVVLENYPQRFKNAELSTDIYSYKDLDSFLIASEKAFQRSNRKIQLKDEIDMVDEFDGIVILYPSTAEASCYYGKGTKWCVTNTSTYEDYMDEGNLFFILNKSSNGDDYKTALYVDALGKVKCFDSEDKRLTVNFGDVDRIEYDRYAGSIIYPKKVSSSIKKYIQDKIVDKPKQLAAKAFVEWVKSIGLGYKAKIKDISDQEFELYKVLNSGFKSIGDYVIADSEKLKEIIEDIDTYDVLNYSEIKTNNLIKRVGENKILKYFYWDDLFYDILMDGIRFRFFYEYDINNLTDEEIEKSPELNDLKKEFMKDPVGFYNDNVYKGSSGTPPKYRDFKGLRGMFYKYENYFDIERLLEDYPTYCIDAKAEPITWKYNDKNYYIMNKRSDNEEIYD